MGVVGELFELDPHKGFKVEIKGSFFFFHVPLVSTLNSPPSAGTFIISWLILFLYSILISLQRFCDDCNISYCITII